MKRFLMISVAVSALAFAGCASTMPMEGGRMDDHATTVAKCGVGNFTFRYLKGPCEAPTQAAVDEYDYEYSEEDTIGLSESSASFAGSDVDLTQEVTFRTGSAAIDREGRETLNDIAWVIRQNEDRIRRVNIEGHADATGTPARNQALSQARAQAVKSYLVSRGVDARKLSAVGYGESLPKFNTSTSTPEELATNRRVDFAVETYDED